MKEKTYLKQIIKILFIACCFTLIFVDFKAQAVSTQCDTYSGDNVDYQNYTVMSSMVSSYLINTEDGQLMRFQSLAWGDKYLVEYYDTDFNLQKTVKINQELGIFGAFYADETGYYILSGECNPDEDDSVEVFRLTKYDKSWNRIGSAGLYGVNTYWPFSCGSARMISDGNLLFIRTCHTMYATSDGINHQANVTIEVNTDSMEVISADYDISNVSTGYISHSFNEFIRLDDGYVVGVDHGDGYTRSVELMKYKTAYSESGYGDSCNFTSMLDIPGAVGQNATGVSVGGFEISSDHYLVAGNAVEMGDNYDVYGTRNIFVSSVDRGLEETPVLHQITSYAEGDTSPGTPQFVKLSSDSFLLLWMKDDVLNYCKINGEGSIDGSVYTMDGKLSDCVPVVSGHEVIWYTWDNETNVFYKIDLDSMSGSSEKSVNGHRFSVKYATDNDSTATKTCKVCGYEESFTTMDSFSVWWWHGGSGSSGISKKQKEGASCSISVRSFDPDSSENIELVLSTSEEAIASVEGDTINFLKAGEVTITIAAKYRPTVCKKVTFTVVHDPTDEGTVIKEATCAEEGQTQYTCAYCGDTYTEPIEKPDHSFEYTCAGKNSNIAYQECSKCGLKNSFTTLNYFSLWWWSGWQGYAYISTEQNDGSSVSVSLRSRDPDDVDNTELKLSSSDSSIASIDGYTINFLKAGKVTITIAAKYHPSVNMNVTFTVKHTANDEVKVIKQATFTENGTMEYTCAKCGEVVQSAIQKLQSVKLSYTTIAYSGAAKKPVVNVVDAKKNTVSSDYYTVAYASGRKNVGKYKVTVKFKDKYTGTKTLYFTINPKGTSLKSLTSSTKAFTVKWTKQSAQTTGYQIQYSTSSKFTSAKTITVSSAGTTSKKISKLSGKKKYYVRIRTYKNVSGAKYYSGWSKTKTVTTK